MHHSTNPILRIINDANGDSGRNTQLVEAEESNWIIFRDLIAITTTALYL